jgi:hypothetical protein
MFNGLPVGKAIARITACARQMDATTDKLSAQRQHSDFGQLLCAAVQRRLPRNKRSPKADQDDERDTFEAKLKRAVQARMRFHRPQITRQA